MLLTRRSALLGLLAAPAIVKATSLMPVRVPPLVAPRYAITIETAYPVGPKWAVWWLDREGLQQETYGPVGEAITIPAGATIRGASLTMPLSLTTTGTAAPVSFSIDRIV